MVPRGRRQGRQGQNDEYNLPANIASTLISMGLVEEVKAEPKAAKASGDK
jgi:hypothetical protein